VDVTNLFLCYGQKLSELPLAIYSVPGILWWQHVVPLWIIK
jgi:hypothetical protein